MENDFENKMENLKTPDTEFVKHQETLKIGMMNIRKSARIGILFILIPIVLVLLAYLKITILMHFDFFSHLMQFTTTYNQPNSHIWLLHLAMIGFPLMAIFINLIAITHFQLNKVSKELVITIKYKLKNLIIIFISVAIIWALFAYILLMK